MAIKLKTTSTQIDRSKIPPMRSSQERSRIQ